MDLSIDFTSIYLLLKLEQLIKKRNQIKAAIKKEMLLTHNPNFLDEIETSSSTEKNFSNSKRNVYKKCDLMPKNKKEQIRFIETNEIRKPKSYAERLCNRSEMCDVCGKLIKRPNMEYHINAHYNRKPYVCPFDYCKRSFGSPSLLVCHRRLHSDERKFSCDLCSKSFHFRTDLRKHKIIHLEPKFECKICNHKFKSKDRLKHHMLTHEESENILCTIKSCGKTLKNSFTLRTHLRKCHKIKVKFPIPSSN